MKPSKLERYYAEHFADLAPEREEPPRPERRPAPVPPPRRSGRRRRRSGPFGKAFFLLKMVLLLGPLTVLVLSSLVFECGTRTVSGLVPDFLRSSACTRQDLTRHVLAIEGSLKTLADRLR